MKIGHHFCLGLLYDDGTNVMPQHISTGIAELGCPLPKYFLIDAHGSGKRNLHRNIEEFLQIRFLDGHMAT